MRPRALDAVVAVVVAPIVSAQGDARSIADRAVREEGGEVCAAVVLPSFGDPPVSILALYDAGRRGLCDLILRIAPGNPPQIIERIKISFLRTFDTVLQDLDHNGDLEVVVPDRWGGGRHYRCEPEKSVVYRCDRAQCTDASASFPSFFTKELAAVNRNLPRLKNMTSDA